jgi:hypothetical protein
MLPLIGALPMHQRSVAVITAHLLICTASFGGTSHVVISLSPFGSSSAIKSNNTENAIGFGTAGFQLSSIIKTANTGITTGFGVGGFQLSRIDKSVVSEFQKAWWASHGGTSFREGVVLIFRKLDGNYMAKSMGKTNQHKSFTFTWAPNAIAIVHTHPNSSDPKPSPDDIRIAEKFGIPVCTITRWGMYVYDPVTKSTSKVKENLDWLDSTKFNREPLTHE